MTTMTGRRVIRWPVVKLLADHCAKTTKCGAFQRSTSVAFLAMGRYTEHIRRLGWAHSDETIWRGTRMASRRLVTWEAIHENGWTTTVAQRPDGTFVAITENTAGLRLSDVAVTLEDACDAVRRALARGGHSQCSLGCSEWAMRLTRTKVDPSVHCSLDSSEAPAAAPVVPSSGREGRTARRWSH
jgi:hypothetical protein